MNVLKEELPEERQSRFWAFALGAAAYAALLLIAFWKVVGRTVRTADFPAKTRRPCSRRSD